VDFVFYATRGAPGGPSTASASEQVDGGVMDEGVVGPMDANMSHVGADPLGGDHIATGANGGSGIASASEQVDGGGPLDVNMSHAGAEPPGDDHIATGANGGPGIASASEQVDGGGPVDMNMSHEGAVPPGHDDDYYVVFGPDFDPDMDVSPGGAISGDRFTATGGPHMPRVEEGTPLQCVSSVLGVHATPHTASPMTGSTPAFHTAQEGIPGTTVRRRYAGRHVPMSPIAASRVDTPDMPPGSHDWQDEGLQTHLMEAADSQRESEQVQEWRRIYPGYDSYHQEIVVPLTLVTHLDHVAVFCRIQHVLELDGMLSTIHYAHTLVSRRTSESETDLKKLREDTLKLVSADILW
jgi:hypothetical protein